MPSDTPPVRRKNPWRNPSRLKIVRSQKGNLRRAVFFRHETLRSSGSCLLKWRQRSRNATRQNNRLEKRSHLSGVHEPGNAAPQLHRLFSRGAAQELMHPCFKPQPQQPFAHGHGTGRGEVQLLRALDQIGEVDMGGKVRLARGLEQAGERCCLTACTVSPEAGCE